MAARFCPLKVKGARPYRCIAEHRTRTGGTSLSRLLVKTAENLGPPSSPSKEEVDCYEIEIQQESRHGKGPRGWCWARLLSVCLSVCRCLLSISPPLSYCTKQGIENTLGLTQSDKGGRRVAKCFNELALSRCRCCAAIAPSEVFVASCSSPGFRFRANIRSLPNHNS